MSELSQELSLKKSKTPARKAGTRKATPRKAAVRKQAAGKRRPSDHRDIKVMQAKLLEAVKQARSVRAGVPRTVNILGIQKGTGEAISLSAVVEKACPSPPLRVWRRS